MDDYEHPINELSVATDTVAIQVADGVGGVQLCPALILGSSQALPAASKHIYSRLSAAASEVDEGVPDLILSLVSHGNQLSSKFLSSVESALSPLVLSSGLWLISSGEYDDPLARAASNTIRSVLPQAENPVEVLHLMVNNYEDILVQSGLSMVDTSLNTLLLLSRKESSLSKAKLKAQSVIRLSHPPPALLIGVPSDHISTGMTPATQAAPILLSPSNDKRPLPAVLFAGSSTESLEELLVYIEHGVPVIILQDSCELCAVLHRAALLYRTPQFAHKRFVSWLNEQLHSVGYQDVDGIVFTIIQMFSIAVGEPQLIEFLDSDDIFSLSSKLVDLCVQCYSSPTEIRQVVLLAGRLNQPGAISPLLSSETLDDDLMADLLCECVAHNDRVDFLASVLEARPQLNVSSNMLIRMANAADQHFYTTIILSHCMDYSTIPEEVDEQFAHDINMMLKSLSFGMEDLFPTTFFTGDVLRKDTGQAIKILAIWCLLLHKPKLVRCFCAYSEEPLAFSLVLTRIARSLSHEARDWYFYSDSLNQLADKLTDSATSILDGVHEKTSQKAYQMVCQPIEEFHGATITQMAFQANCRSILAHETCQRWVHRLLYGHLQPRGCFSFLPAWFKILISAVFIAPIKFWISMRPAFTHSKDSKSPTVALLDVSRQVQRRTRTYSVISGRSDALTNLTAPLSVNLPHQLTSGGESATPQSIVFPLNIEEPDNENNIRFAKKKRIRRWASPSLRLFYSTPIAKYWLSLVFRLLHISLMVYALLLPGCGSLYLDAIVWVWSFMWWMESLWVLNLRSQTTELSVMPWRVFDIIVTFVFLLLLLVFKVFGEGIISEIFYLSSAYPARVLNAFFLLYWCYATLFYYIPLSDIFGPLMVRVKLMILRDFINFLIMIALIMASSAAAIQAVVYPDRALTFSIVKSLLSWIWLSLFTTDLSSLHESQECRKSFLGAPKQYCSAVSEYANSSCPSQSWPAYVVLLEYFVLLKLVLWPILFAFFAKTAKAVDDEADKIWKFQLYTLVTDFSARPPLPPPLTPFFFLYMACCKAKSHYFHLSLNSPEHPDSPNKKPRVTMRYGSVYRNPSVPFKKNEFLSSFWRKTAIEHWKKENKRTTPDSLGSQVRSLQEQLRMLALTHSYKKQESFSQRENFTREYGDSGVEKMVLTSSEMPWNMLMPKYSPPFYCKPVEEFPVEMARFVETASELNVTELKRAWRNRQLSEYGKGWTLSSSGFPLNPNGRQGIAGRGNHPKFGPNRRCYYIIIVGTSKSDARVLLEEKNGIPNEAHPETGPRDEHLASLLRLTGIAEGDAQLLSMRRMDTSIIADDHNISMSDTSPAHLDVQVVAHENDTDNAWTEHDIWAVSLRNRKVNLTLPGYRWLPVASAPGHISPTHVPLLAKALRIYGIH